MSASPFKVVVPESALAGGGQAPRAAGEGVREAAVALLAALQTTLEAERVIAIFADHLMQVVPHDGLVYVNDAERLAVRRGRKARHTASYRLTLGMHGLGELTLQRDRRFTEDELAAAEYLTCHLMYPLRNALLYRQAMRSAHEDPVTGIQNRAALERALRREVELARRHGTRLAVVLFDIDHFKTVNDRYGHLHGDCVLRFVAQRAAACMRTTDMLFRYGGEEFVALLSNTGAAGGARVAARIRRAIEDTPCECDGARVQVTVSLGVAELREGEGPEALLARADTALYQAKAGGRNCVRLAGEP